MGMDPEFDKLKRPRSRAREAKRGDATPNTISAQPLGIVWRSGAAQSAYHVVSARCTEIVIDDVSLGYVHN